MTTASVSGIGENKKKLPLQGEVVVNMISCSKAYQALESILTLFTCAIMLGIGCVWGA